MILRSTLLAVTALIGASPVTAQVPPDLAALDALIVQDESGGENVPNYRYDRHHTAGGKGQITDETWLRVAPTLDIDVKKFSKAGMASEFDQDRVRWKLLATEGVGAWACCNSKLREHLKELNLSATKASWRRAIDTNRSPANESRSEAKVSERVPEPFQSPAVTPSQMIFTVEQR